VTLYKISVIVLMLLLNGVFAAFEMALASISRSRLLVLANQQRRGAKAALFMKHRMEASLAVVQVGITFAGAIAAAVGGVGIDESLSPSLARVLPVSANLVDAIAIAIFVLPLSAITIVFSELVPKMFAIRNAELVCLKLAPAMRLLSAIMYPVVALFEKVVKAIMVGGQKLIRREGAEEAQGLHELHAAVAIARTARLIGAREERILHAAAQFPSRPIDTIMVPAESISMLSVLNPLSEALLIAHLDLHTRFPVCAEQDNPQTIIGYVTFKDLVVALRMDAQSTRLKSIMRPIKRFRSSESIAQVLETMMRDRGHIALVETDKGEVLGMVTLEDIMEELVGEIEDEFDRLPAHMHQTGAGWITGGGVRMGVVASTVCSTGPQVGPELKNLTLADWCARILGRAVEKGETIKGAGLVINVRKLRRHRIAECFLTCDNKSSSE
jgi:putative hemolysin